MPLMVQRTIENIEITYYPTKQDSQVGQIQNVVTKSYANQFFVCLFFDSFTLTHNKLWLFSPLFPCLIPLPLTLSLSFPTNPLLLRCPFVCMCVYVYASY